MSAERPSKDELFNAAAELVDAAERQAYLDEVCADDHQLREEIEDLLERDLDAGSFLESPPPGLSPTLDQPITERPGTVIGPYKLLQEIGHGGMGVVYMAVQSEPVECRVALKIIKLGWIPGR